MLSAEDQLVAIEARLLATGGVIRGTPRAVIDDRDEIGRMRATVEYPSGHQFHVGFTVDVTPGYPVWVEYELYLQGPDGRCVFRYDNARHYPGVETFPHHKHVGPDERVMEATPNLRTILREVREAVGFRR